MPKNSKPAAKPAHKTPARTAKPELVQVRINPATERLSHTVQGVIFKAGVVREYDLSDPAQRAFVDEYVRPARKVSGRTDTPLVFIVETQAEAQARARAEQEKSRSPRGSALAPVRGQVPQKPQKQSPRAAATAY